jgi:lysozyme
MILMLVAIRENGETLMLTLEMRQALWKMEVKNEGLRYKIYGDEKGIPTIGIGRNLAAVGLRPDEIELMFENDINACWMDLVNEAWFNALNEARQIVIIDMVFNLGWKGFQEFDTFIKFLQKEDWKGAATDLLSQRIATEEPSRTQYNAQVIEKGVLQ